MDLKIMLLACGVRLNDDTKKFAQLFKKAVFSSFDIRLSDGTYVNVPYKINFADLSPFSIHFEKGKYSLFYFDNFIDFIEIENLQDAIYNNSDTNLSEIFYFATDRIRIKIQSGCDLKMKGQGCKFCNVPKLSSKFNINEIIKYIPLIESKINFRHYLIGGGSDLNADSWDKIMLIAKYIKFYSKKEITLMSIAPESKTLMENLKCSGIDDVSFNLEICNDCTAKALMPYKGIPRKDYLQRLETAVTVWGKFNVRSILLVGLEPDEILLNMVERICACGVQPVLSVFRPLEGSELESLVPLESEHLKVIFDKVKSICSKYGTEPGPKCIACRNNTLSL